MKMLDVLVQLLLPKAQCLACGQPRQMDVDEQLCDDCIMALQYERLMSGVCLHCLSPRRSDHPCEYCANGGMQHLRAAYAPFHYHGVVQQLVVKLKFGAVDDAAHPLANAMLDSIFGIPFDAMVPVPLHAKRLSERGINQASLLCDILSTYTSIPVLHALFRTRNTKRQSSMFSLSKRSSNVDGAFRLAKEVKGLHLLLVDDVRTSGATARACAKALCDGGAAEVSLLTAAVAPPRKHKGVLHV